MNFFLNENEEFFIRQLARQFGTSAGNIRRELLKLEELEIVKKRKIGNLVLYSTNSKTSSHSYWRRIIMENIGVDELFKPIIAQFDKIKIAFIYGSFASGDYDKDSDIDLMIILSNELSTDEYTDFNSEIAKTEGKLNREINTDIFPVTELEEKIRENNSYLTDVLHNQKIFVKGGEGDIRLRLGQKTKS